MRAGVLRHLPESGSAMDQSDVILNNITYAVRTWQIDRKEASAHTPDDIEFMREIVQPRVANG